EGETPGPRAGARAGARPGDRAGNRSHRRAHRSVIADVRADLAMKRRLAAARIENELHRSGTGRAARADLLHVEAGDDRIEQRERIAEIERPVVVVERRNAGVLA